MYTFSSHCFGTAVARRFFALRCFGSLVCGFRKSTSASQSGWLRFRPQAQVVARSGYPYLKPLPYFSPSNSLTSNQSLTLPSSDKKVLTASSISQQKLPRAYCEMSNETLLIYAARNNTNAVREVLTREIMAVDNVSWHGAQARLNEMDEANRKGMFVGFLPYKMGLLASVAAGIASIPLTYYLPTIMWFNEHYVTADVPPAKYGRKSVRRGRHRLCFDLPTYKIITANSVSRTTAPDRRGTSRSSLYIAPLIVFLESP